MRFVVATSHHTSYIIVFVMQLRHRKQIIRVIWNEIKKSGNLNRSSEELLDSHQTPRLNNLHFHPFEVVPSHRDSQLHVGKYYLHFLNLRPNISKTWCLTL